MTLQTTIAIAALISAIAMSVAASGTFLRELREKGFWLDLRESDGGGIRYSRLLDLAFVLISGAFFSLLLVDALLVSGRTLSVLSSALATLGITSLVSLSLLFMWYRGRAEMGIAWWAIVTLALLASAPGGPFIEGEPGTPDGINLWVPVLVLVFITVAMWVYLFGHPLDRTSTRLNRIQVRLVLLIVVLIGLVTLGRQYRNFVENDRRTPDISAENVRDLIKEVTDASWNVTQSRVFYAVASDAHLISEYESQYQSVAAELEDLELVEFDICNPAIVSFLESLFVSSFEAEEIACEIDLMEDEEEVRAYLTDDLLMEESDVEQIIELSQISFDVPSIPGLRQTRLEQLVDFFRDLPRQDQLGFLAHRLTWIHPVGQPGQDQPAIPLPGITAEDRYDAMAISRLEHSLSSQPNTAALLREFDYPQTINDRFGADPLGLGNLQPFGPFDSLIADDEDEPAIFTDLGNRYYVRRLQEQLSLPAQYEAYVAFSQYRILAEELQTQALARDSERPISGSTVQEILDSLEDLEPNRREALIHYLVESEESAHNYQALLSLSEIDLTPLQDQDSTAALREIVRQIEPGGSIDEESPFAEIAGAILDIPSGDERDYIIQLLDNQDPLIPVYNLLQEDVMDLLTTLDARLVERQREELFSVIKNPIGVVMPQLLEGGFLDQEFVGAGEPDILTSNFVPEAKAAFDRFNQAKYEEQRSYLHQSALGLYQASGRHAHSTFSLIISQASAWRDEVGLAVASVMSSPFVILVALVGMYAARRLTARDRLRALVVSEASQRGRAQFALGMTDQVRGREGVISQLVSLAGRGWSSIAVVGRRGVGKTRILYELLRGGQGNGRPRSITAWVSAPSKFEEAEFIESVFERLTADIESAISRCLGAKPLEVRRLETNSMLAGVAIYVVFVLLLAIVFGMMSAGRVGGQIISTWFPVFLAFIASNIALIVHVTRIQPVDLSPWLERDRSSNPHTVLLYREARRARAFLDERRSLDSEKPDSVRWATTARRLAIGFLVLLFIIALFNMLISGLTILSMVYVFTSGSLLVGLMRLRVSFIDVRRGYSLMSLVSEYRDFVERTVYRVRKGALGDYSEQDFEVVVCIDELDKIIDPDELRAFLRRMKPILEIPGAYYYLSLSEDALRALYLGAAEGKNEVDSTFDHIVPVPPVEAGLGAEIAGSYLRKTAGVELDERVHRMIAAVSYGVPRDIIRRCDELLAQGDPVNVPPETISDNMRQRQATLAFGEQLLTKRQAADFSEDAVIAANRIREFFGDEMLVSRAMSRSLQVALSLWVLALLSIAATHDDERWESLSEQLRDVGYRIPDEPVDDLVEELLELHVACLDGQSVPTGRQRTEA